MKGKKGNQRPRAALITNHGYAAPSLPLGGAPDTGGQNLYVHNLAYALEALGYDVTIFARGGFPHFDSDKVRKDTEPLTKFIRYHYLSGGPAEFIRKEDIAVALDEELEELVRYVDREAERVGCNPWEVYEFINTHYWDAGVLGVGLVERWRNRIAVHAIADLTRKVVTEEQIQELRDLSKWRAVGKAPAFYLGKLLLDATSEDHQPITDRVKTAVKKWARASGKDPKEVLGTGQRVDQVYPSVDRMLQPMVAAEAVGKAVLKAMARKTARLGGQMALADRHVWTPHSLGVLKQEGFVDRTLEEQRSLKFCERRHHEIALTEGTRVFVATSEAIAERLMTTLGVGPQQLFYFPPCVDESIFRPYAETECSDAYGYLSEKSSLSVADLKKARIVFETSRADSSKRKDLLLKAFSKIVEDFDDTYLFIGGGPENDVVRSLRELRDALPGLKGRAFVLGFVPDEHMGPLFSMADLYVTPSEMEGFGMSAAQAAAGRTALVCSDRVPFAVQYVPEHAVVVPAGDEEGFADAMTRLLSDDEDRDDRAGRLAKAVKSLEWTVQTRAFLRHLKRQRFPVTVISKGGSK